jgi:23S rRNA-/tRNA-specific pseudouridylate synthase
LGLGEIFDPPLNAPPPAPPPYGSGAHVHLGEISASLLGQPAWSLVIKLFPAMDPKEAMALVEFGSLWFDDRVVFDPMADISAKNFRLNLPAYGPRVYYEIDPARLALRDGDLLVYDKEAGPPTVPAPHDSKNNLLAALERYTGLTLRAPHRLDAATSGLTIVAANRLAASRLGQAFSTGKIKKRYLALTRGPKPAFEKTLVEAVISKEAGRYKASAGGPGYPSRTALTVLGEYGDKVLFLAEPLTGRTHQIRLHMAYLGYPIEGDRLYGGGEAPRLMLRASGLAFGHPGTGKAVTLGGPWP